MTDAKKVGEDTAAVVGTTPGAAVDAPVPAPGAAAGQPPAEPFDPVAALAELEAAMAEADAAAAAQGGDAAGRDQYTALLESEVLELNGLLETKEAALREARARADEAHEEVDRTRARLEKEAQTLLERRFRKLLLTFVDVFDDLERALAAAHEVDHNPEVVAGIELVLRRFATTLEGHGVRRLESLGQPFDPQLHEAISTVPAQDPGQEGCVVVVVREGYAIGEEGLLRPAAVVVGRKG